MANFLSDHKTVLQFLDLLNHCLCKLIKAILISVSPLPFPCQFRKVGAVVWSVSIPHPSLSALFLSRLRSSDPLKPVSFSSPPLLSAAVQPVTSQLNCHERKMNHFRMKNLTNGLNKEISHAYVNLFARETILRV